MFANEVLMIRAILNDTATDAGGWNDDSGIDATFDFESVGMRRNAFGKKRLAEG